MTNLQEKLRIFGHQEVSFNQEIISATGLKTGKVVLSFEGKRIPVVLYAASMKTARIIIQIDPSIVAELRDLNRVVNLHLAFEPRVGFESAFFYVKARICEVLNLKNDVIFLLGLQFITQAPDDLIRILGGILELKTVGNQRTSKRVVITDDIVRKFRIQPDRILLFCDGKPSRCALRDLSLSGAKVITSGKGCEFVNKRAMLSISVYGVEGMGEMVCDIVRQDLIQNNYNASLASLGLNFDQRSIPLSYKLWLNHFIRLMEM